MIFDIIFRPTASFELAVDSKFEMKSALLVIIFSGLFLSTSVFLLTNNLVVSIFSFIANIINWIILGWLLFFFEFIHIKKKTKSSKGFNRSLFIVSELWKINLISYVLVFLGCLILPQLGSGFVFDVVAGIFFVLLIALVISWIFTSSKMLKVVLKISKWKLLVNWIIFMFLNSLISFC